MIENNYSQVPIEVESSNKKKLFLIIGGLLLVVVIGVVLFFVFRNSPQGQNENNIQKNPSDSATQSGQPVVDPFPNDKDRDGLADDQEKNMGLSDLQFDTDSDGLSDVDEIEVWKTDPKKFDSDGDNFGDGYEVINGYDPLGAGKKTL